eukprot:gene18065-biopygen23397
MLQNRAPIRLGHLRPAQILLQGCAVCVQGETTADVDRTRTGRGPHGRIQRNGRGPDAGAAASPRGIDGLLQGWYLQGIDVTHPPPKHRSASRVFKQPPRWKLHKDMPARGRVA